jgi:hypothetical protein
MLSHLGRIRKNPTEVNFLLMIRMYQYCINVFSFSYFRRNVKLLFVFVKICFVVNLVSAGVFLNFAKIKLFQTNSFANSNLSHKANFFFSIPKLQRNKNFSLRVHNVLFSNLILFCKFVGDVLAISSRTYSQKDRVNFHGSRDF